MKENRYKIADFIFVGKIGIKFFEEIFSPYKIDDGNHNFDFHFEISQNLFDVSGKFVKKDKNMNVFETQFGTALCFENHDEKIVMVVEFSKDYKFVKIGIDSSFNDDFAKNYGMLYLGLMIGYRLLVLDAATMHGSVVSYRGKAIIYTAPSGTGKSTQTKMWKKLFGDDASIINDDKPAMRFFDDKLYAYGMPICGKDNLNENAKAEVKAIVNVKRATKNKMRKLFGMEAVAVLFEEMTRSVLSKIVNEKNALFANKILQTVPVYELECLPNEEAVLLVKNVVLGCLE